MKNQNVPHKYRALPPETLAKLERLQDAAELDLGAVRSANDMLDEEFRAHSGAWLAYERALGGRDIDKLEPDDRQRIEGPLLAVRARRDRAKAIVETAAARHTARHAFLSEVDSFLGESFRHGVKFRAANLKTVKITDPQKQIVAVRERVASLEAEWDSVEHAPAPADELFENFQREFERLASVGRPDLSVTSRGGDPTNVTRILNGGGISAETMHMPGMTMRSLGALLAWANHDAILAGVRAEIYGRDLSTALRYDQREKEFARLSAAMMAAEREEEALVCAAETAGLPVYRRRHASPLAILEIEEV